MRRSIIPATLVAALLVIAATAFAQEAPSPITASEVEAAIAGEVLIEAERGDVNRGEVIGLVTAPIAAVSEIVRDTETHDQWFPDTVESHRVSSGGSASITDGRTHLPLLRDRYWRLNGTHSQVTFDGRSCEVMAYNYDHSYADGNMDELYGYWLLCPEGDATLVKYVINADLGVWLPGPVITWAQRRMLPGIIEGLNERYEDLN